MGFNPMLAGEGKIGEITYPKVALLKHNGVRAGVQDGILLARSLKPIPNKYCQELYSYDLLNDYEGELVVGDPLVESVFTSTTSGVMTKTGQPDVCLYLFDMYHPRAPFIDRIKQVHKHAELFDSQFVQAIPYEIVESDEELLEYNDYAQKMNYEGLVLRDPMGIYKEGRATDAEGTFLRFVPWYTSEAKIVGIEEGQVNNNESKPNELGFLKKSSAKAGKVPSGRAGAFLVEDLKTGAWFAMPVPTVKLQDEVWANKEKFLGAIARYRYKKGVKGNIPRYAQFDGLRDRLDM